MNDIGLAGFSRTWRWRVAVPWLAAGLLAAAALSGCGTLGYYWQSASGHLQLMNAARPIAQVVADPATAPRLRARLLAAQRIREFAVTDLHLPDNASYRRYTDLHRSAVVWNVVAAPPDSLTLHNWCYPVLGCVGYRGYFDENAAQAQAATLTAQGLETAVYGVPAYSTLGWMNWLGGDPLPSTLVALPEGELARLMFHELAHQVLYVPGDTAFNESFATTVERAGGAQWLATQADAASRAEYAAFDMRRQQMRTLNRRTRQALQSVYRQPAASFQGLTENMPNIGVLTAVGATKNEVMTDYRAGYAALRKQWLAQTPRLAAQLEKLDDWVARANNASFAIQSAYDDLVAGFEALLAQERTNSPSASAAWPRFYAAVKALAALPKDERHRQIKALAAGP